MESFAVQPVLVLVAVTVYRVVFVGLAVGLLMVDELRCAAGVQLYVKPVVAVAPIVIEVPAHTDLLPPADTVGAARNLMVSALEVAVAGDTQFDELLNTQVIISPFDNKESLYVAWFLPTFDPFFFH
jgi:hypothetical protein